MAKKVLIIDTCILCIYLEIPGMSDAGPDDDKWDYDRVKDKLEEEEAANTKFVLPVAALIETGNHITQNGHFDHAQKLADFIILTAEGEIPWAAFSDQNTLWSPESLEKLAKEWPTTCDSLSLGDATIKEVAEHYSKYCNVELLTADAGLKAYEPIPTEEVVTPRRRS